MRNANKLKNSVLQITRNIYDERYGYCPTVYSEKESQKISEIFVRQKLTTLGYSKLADYGIQVSDLLLNEYEENIIRCDIFLSVIQELVTQFAENDIEVAVLKGIALSYQTYRNHNSRISKDIDLLVHEKDMEKADLLLRKLGYEQFNNYLSTQTLEKPLYKYADCHEYFPYRKEINGRFVYVELAKCLHWIKSSDTIDKLFKYKTYITIKNVRMPVITSKALIVQMIENIYENAESSFNIIFGGTTLSNYVDFAFYVKNNQVSAKEIAEAIEEFDVQAYAKVVLNYMKEIFYLDGWVEDVWYHLGLPIGNEILPRIFDHTTQVQDYLCEMKKQIYSPANPYFATIGNHEYVYFYNQEKSCKARFWWKKQKILIDLALNGFTLEEFHDCMLEIKVYNNILQDSVFCMSAMIYSDNGQFYISFNKLSDKFDNTYFIKAGLHKTNREKIGDKIRYQNGQVLLSQISVDAADMFTEESEVLIAAIGVTVEEKQAENIYFNPSQKKSCDCYIPLINIASSGNTNEPH